MLTFSAVTDSVIWSNTSFLIPDVHVYFTNVIIVDLDDAGHAVSFHCRDNRAHFNKCCTRSVLWVSHLLF